MARIDAAELLPAARIREGVLAGDITQLHRGDPHAEVGDTFVIEDTEFVVTSVERRRLGAITEEDARAEGSPNLEAYRRRIEAAHGTTWDDDNEAVRHEFEPADP
jgi:hypothetical protein